MTVFVLSFAANADKWNCFVCTRFDMSTVNEKYERYLKRREIFSSGNERGQEKQREKATNRQMDTVKQFQQDVRHCTCTFLCDKAYRMVSDTACK